MIDIHPEIRKFWECGGYTVKPRFQADTVDIYMDRHDMIWDRVKDGRIYMTVAHTYDDGTPPDYFMEDGLIELSEEYMLRIVRLKAFL